MLSCHMYPRAHACVGENGAERGRETFRRRLQLSKEHILRKTHSSKRRRGRETFRRRLQHQRLGFRVKVETCRRRRLHPRPLSSICVIQSSQCNVASHKTAEFRGFRVQVPEIA